MKKFLVLLLFLFTVVSCVTDKGKVTVKGVAPKTSGPLVTNITLTADRKQIVITGSKLNLVNQVQISAPIAHTFDIDSQTSSEIRISPSSALTLTMGILYNFLISDANGAAAYSVNFALQQMGANTGDFLQWNGTTWTPAPITGPNQQGTWDAAANNPALADGVGVAGDYYVVSVGDGAGGTVLDGNDIWSPGDWAYFDGGLGQWVRIQNTNTVSSFNGRQGAILPLSGDYTIDQIASTPGGYFTYAPNNVACSAGEVMKWNGTQWICGTDNGAGAASSTTDQIIEGDSDANASGEIQFRIGGMIEARVTNAGNMQVGADIGTGGGKTFSVGDTLAPATFILGETSNDRFAVNWSPNGKYVSFATKEAGVDYGDTLIMKEGNVGFGVVPPDAQYKVIIKGQASGVTPINLRMNQGANTTTYERIMGFTNEAFTFQYGFLGISSEALWLGSGNVTNLHISTAQPTSILRLQHSGGNAAIGNITPTEKFEVGGAIKIATASGTNDGTIQFTGTDFLGRAGGEWVSLTGITTPTGNSGAQTTWSQVGSYIFHNGKVAVGGGAGAIEPTQSVAFQVMSASGGFLPPTMTTVERDVMTTTVTGAATGLMIYNTDSNKLSVYNGASWDELGTGSGSSVWTQDGTAVYYNSGNVGVGTNSPQGQFHVANNTDNLPVKVMLESVSGNQVYSVGTNGPIGNELAGASTFKIRDETRGLNRLTISTNGAIGIGTTSAAGTLDMGHGAQGRPIVWGGSTGVNVYGALGPINNSADMAVMSGLYTHPGTANSFLYGNTSTYGASAMQQDLSLGDIIFHAEPPAAHTKDVVFNMTNSKRMVIKGSTGNVGIGETSPVGRLVVKGGPIYAEQLCDEFGNNCTDLSTGISVWSETGGDTFYTGNVGINTSTPTSSLTIVSGDIQLDNNQQIKFKRASGANDPFIGYDSSDNFKIFNPVNAEIQFAVNSGTVASIDSAGIKMNGTKSIHGTGAADTLTVDGNSGLNLRSSQAGGNGNISFLQGASEVMTIQPNGNVGIGVTTPSARFQVEDVYRLQMAGAGTQAFFMERVSDGSDIFYINPFSEIGLVGIPTIKHSAVSPLRFYTGNGKGAGVANAYYRFNSPSNDASTSGDAIGIHIQPGAFNPASGNANLVGLLVEPTVNQSGTAIGNYTAIKANVAETSALGGNNRLLDLQVDGNSKFVIQSNGNTGIGTPTPTSKLEIHEDAGPTIKLSSSNALGYALIEDTGTNTGSMRFLARPVGAVKGAIQFGADNNIQFMNRAFNTTKMLIDPNGNIGIGAASPTEEVHIFKNTSGSVVLQMEASNTGSADQSYIAFLTGGGDGVSKKLGDAATTGWAVYGRGENYTGSQGNDFGITYYDGAVWRNDFHIDSLTGYVGVGLVSPSGNFHVSEEKGGGVAIIAENTSTAAWAFAEVAARIGGTQSDAMRMLAMGESWGAPQGGFMTRAGVLDADTYLTNGLSLIARATTGDMRFYAGGNADTDMHMIIQNNGEIGMGIADPLTTLHLHKDNVTDNTISTPLLLQSQWNDAGIEGNDQLGIGMKLCNSGGGCQSYTPIRYSVSPQQMFLAADGGNVSIGSVTPTAKLTVQGEMRTVASDGSNRLWGQGRPGAVRYGTGGAESGLCTNGSISFGLSFAFVTWEGADAACPKGTWVCTASERGTGACNTARPDGTADGIIWSGTPFDWASNAHVGWNADVGSSAGYCSVTIETGTQAGNTHYCANHLPVWCCSE